MSEHAHHPAPAPEADPTRHWEQHYAGARPVWSGRVNPTLAAVLEHLAPTAAAEAPRDGDGPAGRAPRALDLGCGEGADAIWLARHGWVTTGVDISRTAIARARASAEEAGLAPQQLHLLAADLSDPAVDADLGGPFDLVTASFFHSTVTLPRPRILRRAAALLAPGGRLLILSHAAPPPWARGDSAHRHEDLLDPPAELAALDLPPGAFQVELAELRERAVTAPDGAPARLEDGVVLLRRR